MTHIRLGQNGALKHAPVDLHRRLSQQWLHCSVGHGGRLHHVAGEVGAGVSGGE
jgi:hypothetical protein